MKFNINNHIRVKLTDKGRQEHKLWHYTTFGTGPFSPYVYEAPKEDKNGYSKWQLWDLMRVFGHLSHNGCENPFDTEIVLVKPKPLTQKQVHDLVFPPKKK